MTKDKNKNQKKIKEVKYRSEEQESIIRFIKILVIVILFIVLIYFATRLFVKKDLIDDKNETTVTDVNYSKMVFGTMLNRPYEEYYVIAYSSEDNSAYYYAALADKYANNEDSLYVYHIDLEDSLNKKYISQDDKTNPDAKNINELKVGDLTLIKVENGKIVKYIEKINEIKIEFGIK